MKRIISLLPLLLVILLFTAIPVSATGGANLLVNPGMEEPYIDVPMRSVPSGWNWWINAGNPDFYREQYGSVFAGARSQAILVGGGTFTAGTYQTVHNVPVGSRLRATAWAQLFVAGGGDPTQSYSNMRIGIDPNGGTNPNDGDIVWSASLTSLMATHGSGISIWTDYTELAIEANATGSSVTLFLYGSQNWGANEHRQFWDNAYLGVMGVGSIPTTTTTTNSNVVVIPSNVTTTGKSVEAWVALNVRSGPGAQNNRIGVIYPGSTYAIVSEHPDWYGISYNSGTGYVASYYVYTYENATAQNTVSNPATGSSGFTFSTYYNVNFRAGPATSYNRVAVIPAMTVVDVLGRSGDGNWLQVSYGGVTGWIASWLGTTYGGAIQSIPVTG